MKLFSYQVPKHLSEKAQRIATYSQEKKEVSKWEPIVKKNRKVSSSLHISANKKSFKFISEYYLF